jgi:DNA polymerase I-like protein with 3'-5' exonuclease and polymerase domains
VRWIIAIVDDEIIVETPEVKAEQAKELLEKIMFSVFDSLFEKQVPIEVTTKICGNWGEKHEKYLGMRQLIEGAEFGSATFRL